MSSYVCLRNELRNPPALQYLKRYCDEKFKG